MARWLGSCGKPVRWRRGARTPPSWWVPAAGLWRSIHCKLLCKPTFQVDGNRGMSHVWTDVEAALRQAQLDKVELA